MTIEPTTFTNGREYPKLTECPVCGEAFGNGGSRRSHLYNEHDPEDFGL